MSGGKKKKKRKEKSSLYLMLLANKLVTKSFLVYWWLQLFCQNLLILKHFENSLFIPFFFFYIQDRNFICTWSSLFETWTLTFIPHTLQSLILVEWPSYTPMVHSGYSYQIWLLKMWYPLQDVITHLMVPIIIKSNKCQP